MPAVPYLPEQQEIVTKDVRTVARAWVGWFQWFAQLVKGDTNGATIRWGTGAPENVHAAVVGSVYLRTNGGASTTMYLKETGTGNTGWRAV